MPFLSILTAMPSTQAGIDAIGMSGTMLPTLYAKVAKGIREYFDPVCDYVKYSAKGEVVLIAGHSLGGGISELVGVCAGVQAVSIEGPGVLESQIGMLRESWMQVNGNFNLQANGDIVPFMGTHSGISQRIDCQGFPTIPFASCHVTIASVVMGNCGYPTRSPGHEWQHFPTKSDHSMRYCPGLNDKQEGLPMEFQEQLKKTSSNLWWGRDAFLFNNPDVRIK